MELKKTWILSSVCSFLLYLELVFSEKDFLFYYNNFIMMFPIWIDSTEVRGYISSYFRYFLQIHLESRLPPVSLWTEFQILLCTHTQASLISHFSVTCFCACKGQCIFKNILGGYSKDGLDGWMVLQSIHPYATYRKNKLVYTEHPQHVLTFSAGTHRNVLKLKNEISVVWWGQVVHSGDVCCISWH